MPNMNRKIPKTACFCVVKRSFRSKPTPEDRTPRYPGTAYLHYQFYCLIGRLSGNGPARARTSLDAAERRIPFTRHNEEMSFDFRDQRWFPKSALSLRNYNIDKFLLDFLAGITVGLVALPLAMAFAIASGLTPQAGIYCAIVTVHMSKQKLRVKNTQLDNLICNLRGEVGEVITSWVLLRHMIARERELTSDDVARDPRERQYGYIPNSPRNLVFSF
jgi:Sulfate permease family